MSSIWPTVGAGTGVHVFIGDAFSVDVGLDVDYAAPHARTTTRDEGTTSRGTFVQSSNVVNVGTALGFSVWFR